MIQRILVDVVALLAALWLVWSFAPSSLRRRLTTALPGRRAAKAQGSGCGCGSSEPCED